jgi:SAM-dependent methyltransferase
VTTDERHFWQSIAREYYDGARHPTTAALNKLSRNVLADWFATAGMRTGIVLEVGAGEPVITSLLDLGENLGIALDFAASMLSEPARHKVRLSFLVADAQVLPIKSETIGTLVASLGSPFNVAPFWNEAYRVLTADGVVAFTSPGYAWARSNRRDRRSGSASVNASYETGGTAIQFRSVVRRRSTQVALLKRAGLVVTHAGTVRSADVELGAVDVAVDLLVAQKFVG